MKNVALSPDRIAKKLVISFVLLSLVIVSQNIYAQQASLSLADILIGLRSKKLTLPERNVLLTDAIKKRGITFSLTPEIEKELESTGAEKQLVEAVRQKSPIIKVSSVTPPKPEPTPAATPRPPDFSFYQNRANAHFVKGEFDLAIINYNKVIELNPKEVSTFMSRAAAYFNKEYYDKAADDYGKVIELEPADAKAYFKRAGSYEKLGEKVKAIADYQKTVELDEKNAEAKNSLQRLQAEQAKLLPPKPAETVAVKNSAVPQMVNVGSMKEMATKLTMPVYPQIERTRRTEGLVTVQIELDEEGKVISAKATDGPPSLRSAAEDAARRSKFNPATVGNQAVKSKGYVTYNFKLK